VAEAVPPGKSIGEEAYESFANRYDALSRTKPENAHLERPATRSLLPDPRGLRVLDAGGGPGHQAEWLLDRGARVVLCDATPAMVEIARRRVGDRAEAILRHDLREPLSFARDGSFDLVLCALVLDYLEDWRPVLGEFFRVLMPGGKVVLSCGHPFGDYLYRAKRVAGPVDYFATELFAAAWGGFGEPKPLVRSWRRPLAAALNPLLAAGFVLEEVLEARPTEGFRALDPEGYARFSASPTFLCLRARRP